MIIELVAKNKVSKDEALKITMPYKIFKAINGDYNKMHKGFKEVLGTVEKTMKENIQIVWKQREGKVNRVVFDFCNGCLLDMPGDATKADYKIVIAQLNVLQMGLKR